MRYGYNHRHDNVSPATRWLMYALLAAWILCLTLALGQSLAQHFQQYFGIGMTR